MASTNWRKLRTDILRPSVSNAPMVNHSMPPRPKTLTSHSGVFRGAIRCDTIQMIRCASSSSRPFSIGAQGFDEAQRAASGDHARHLQPGALEQRGEFL